MFGKKKKNKELSDLFDTEHTPLDENQPSTPKSSSRLSRLKSPRKSKQAAKISDLNPRRDTYEIVEDIGKKGSLKDKLFNYFIPKRASDFKKPEGFIDRVIHKETLWSLPFSWADTNGVFCGDDGFWLYRKLPLSSLDNRNRDLIKIIEQFSQTFPDRKTHIALYMWPDDATFPSELPADLHAYLKEAVDVYVPAKMLVFGVALNTTSASVSAVKSLSDHALGEEVPDFSSVYQDVKNLDSFLLSASVGASALSDQDSKMLCYWYSGGKEAPFSAVENENAVLLEDGYQIETASFYPVSVNDIYSPAPAMPSAGGISTTCVSLRFISKVDTKAFLQDAVVVVARRALPHDNPHDLVDDLREVYPPRQVRGLALRQLPSFDSTLPCSVVQLEALSYRTSPAALAHWGFSQSSVAADPYGLFMGLGGPNYTNLTWFNPFGDKPRVLQVTGSRFSGKSFVLEHLTHQASLSGIQVRYLSYNRNPESENISSGRVIAQVDKFDVKQNPLRGAFVIPPSKTYKSMMSSILPYLFEDASNEIAKDIVGVLSKSSLLNSKYSLSLSELAHATARPDLRGYVSKRLDSPGSIGWIMTSPTSASEIYTSGQAWDFDNSTWVDLNSILAGADNSFLTGSSGVLLGESTGSEDVDNTVNPAHDIAVASAILSPHSLPLVVVVDGCNVGPLTAAALKAVDLKGPPVSLILAAPRVSDVDTDVSLTLASPVDLNIIESLNKPVSIDYTTDMLMFLHESYPSFYGDFVDQVARGMLVDSFGRYARLAVAPVTNDMLKILNRNKKAFYQARMS